MELLENASICKKTREWTILIIIFFEIGGSCLDVIISIHRNKEGSVLTDPMLGSPAEALLDGLSLVPRDTVLI